MVAAPIRMLPVFFKEITFRNIGSALWRYCPQFVHAMMNLRARFLGRFDVRLMTADSWISASAVRDNCQRKRIQHSRVRRRIPRCFDGLVRRSSEPLVEMQLDCVGARSGKQRIREALLRII